jgi:hypothetical protein
VSLAVDSFARGLGDVIANLREHLASNRLAARNPRVSAARGLAVPVGATV